MDLQPIYRAIQTIINATGTLTCSHQKTPEDFLPVTRTNKSSPELSTK